LLAEDTALDRRLAELALAETGIPHRLTIAHDGAHAIAILTDLALQAAALPDLILLDLHMPHKSGLEVLAFIKLNEVLRTIPVVMFSGSGEPEDIRQAYRLHVNAYIRKREGFTDTLAAMNAVCHLWLQTAVRTATLAYAPPPLNQSECAAAD